eukprot:2419231-Amphidinium_carterae.2
MDDDVSGTGDRSYMKMGGQDAVEMQSLRSGTEAQSSTARGPSIESQGPSSGSGTGSGGLARLTRNTGPDFVAETSPAYKAPRIDQDESLCRKNIPKI